MNKVGELLGAAAALNQEAAADAPLILAHVLRKDRSWLYAWPEYQLDDRALAQYETLLQRRLDGEPLAYLTGHREFWSLDLLVTPATLIPRPETELLVEAALGLPLQQARVLDLGTGSGAIALALASERPHWHITATDISEEALEVAARNVKRLQAANIRLLHSHWFEFLHGNRPYQLIISNPPYVAEGDPHLREDGLPHEPAAALTAGPDGLNDLRTIVAGAPGFLQPGGWLIVEHGMDQGTTVRRLFGTAGFETVETRQDLERRDRITLGCYSRSP
ncbi:MAG TPA: peptide chain release factor N(5)-glutamine methyltransferase [Thiolapillus brandeum]|uniref:Release factor glutamine methyltransferase n=1 Tax=Thiolapillus brandeum TaxID=1076588 RepID=A0A831RVC4_9GAMM|nr:peptide chain release factor N(5)-glutamine methyltransferase [Thiolapillus brandeum]